MKVEVVSSFFAPQYKISVWTEARPMVGWGGNLQQNGLFSSSTLLTSPTLPQSSFGWSVLSYQPQPQPVYPNASSAYCFHCLQFGRVYNISPA